MAVLYNNAIVEKRNVLNELRSNNMTVQELRFFSIYLSKINPRDITTRTVRFPLSDFQKIMELGRVNVQHIKQRTDSLLMKLVHLPTQSGGFVAFQLFKECKLDKDKNGEWYIEIDAHDKALPLMFDFKDRYFKYELWNALRLKSSNQVRMYEILKQYEGIGRRELPIDELRELLGIAPNEYPRWNNFKVRVLDSCQQALKEWTDICFTYERGKVGRGGKWVTIVFHIQKNNDYEDQLTLDEFIKRQPDPLSPDEDNTILEADELPNTKIDYGSELGNLLGSIALNNEFTVEQVRFIQDLAFKAINTTDTMELCDYLIEKVHKMNAYTPQKEKRFVYLCNMIKNDIEGV